MKKKKLNWRAWCVKWHGVVNGFLAIVDRFLFKTKYQGSNHPNLFARDQSDKAHKWGWN